jgi:hypothetical protein
MGDVIVRPAAVEAYLSRITWRPLLLSPLTLVQHIGLHLLSHYGCASRAGSLPPALRHWCSTPHSHLGSVAGDLDTLTELLDCRTRA